jgi:acetyl esterase/lipase
MLEDGFAVIETVRENCKKWEISPHKIGVMGSSAGGHLVSMLITLFGSYKSSVSLRPDFAVLCYPVISLVESAHVGSWTNLLGEDCSKDERIQLSSEKNVTEKTPPCFIWHTLEDQCVPIENSLMFVSSLRKKGVRFDLHIFEKGGHGLGLKSDFEWGDRCVQWINEKVNLT